MLRYDDGRESNVSLRDLARYPRDDEDGGEQRGKDAGDSKADDVDVDPEGISDVFPGDKDANGHVHMEQRDFPSDGNGADVLDYTDPPDTIKVSLQIVCLRCA